MPLSPRQRPDVTESLTAALRERIMVIDGAMGTAIQRDRPDEAGYRGERFADWPSDVQGNNDLLTLTQPEIIAGIHREYLEAGADIIETNTFNANAISLSDYGMQELAYELNLAAAALARREADAMTERTPDRPRYVAGRARPDDAHGVDLPDVNDPGARNVSYDELVAAYLEAARGLVDGGSDLIFIETIFDTLNAKAAIFAVETLFEEQGRRWPVIISGTITDASGRTLSGQVTEAFWDSVRHVSPLAVGLNCALGAQGDAALHRRDGADRRLFVSCYPNAGLPNAFGEYDEAPEETAAIVAEFAEAGLVNLVGGCCGTTPDHIAAIAKAVDGRPRPRVRPRSPRRCASRASSRSRSPTDSLFVNVGERTNITGSARFRTLIKDGDYDTALSVAAPAGRERRPGHRRQHGRGHDRRRRGHGPLPQARRERARHQPGARHDRLLEVGGHRGRPQVRAGQGDRQLDLAEGGRGGVHRAGPARAQVRRGGRRHGLRRGRPGRLPRAAQGRSARGRTASSPRRWASRPRTSSSTPTSSPSPPASRSTRPTASTSSRPRRWIKGNLPGAKVSGGISNVSFSFRGNNPVREAIHAVFLYHAIAAGLDMGIVNAGALVVYDQVDPELRERIEDVVLNRRPDAAERLLEIAEEHNRAGQAAEVSEEEWRALPARGADHARPRQGDRRARRVRHRAAARRDRRARRPADRGDRGPAHGRHERRRRPLRRRQDVPPAGRQERPRDEEGRRVPHPVHRGRRRPPTRAWRRRRNQGQDRHGDRQGRRPRHRQEHRRCRAAVQQLRGHRPRRHGAGAEDPRRGARSTRPTSSACPG